MSMEESRPSIDIYRQLAEISDPEQRERTRREWGLVGLDKNGQFSDVVPYGDGPQSWINRAIIESIAFGDTPAVDDGPSPPSCLWWEADPNWLRGFDVMGPRRPPQCVRLPSSIGGASALAPAVSVGGFSRLTCLKTRRQPSCLTEREVGGLYDAVSFFNREFGLVLNAFITIVYPLLGIKDHRAAARLLWRFNHYFVSARDC